MWAALKTEYWAEIASASSTDKDFFNAVDGLHQTVIRLKNLIQSLSDYLSNRTSTANDSDFVSLIAFIHDLRAPLAGICSFSEPRVIGGINSEAHFSQWRDLMMSSLNRTDRVVTDYASFFTHSPSMV